MCWLCAMCVCMSMMRVAEWSTVPQDQVRRTHTKDTWGSCAVDWFVVSVYHGYGWCFDAVLSSLCGCADAFSTCVSRNPKTHDVGPSYPQGLTVVAPAPESVRGLYVVATNNKEDVVVTKVSFDEL